MNVRDFLGKAAFELGSEFVGASVMARILRRRRGQKEERR